MNIRGPTSHEARCGPPCGLGLEAGEELVVLLDVSEQGQVLLEGVLLLLLAEGGGAVGEGDDVEAALVAGADGGFDAAVGEEAGDGDGLDAAAAQDEGEVGAGEGIQTALAF